MYNLISVETEDGSYGVEFNKGLAVDLDGAELTLYPVNLTPEEFNGIVAALGNSIVSE